MKTTKVVLSDGKVMCPCCGYGLRVGATIRLKATREIGQMPLVDDEVVNEWRAAEAEAMEEAERHG